MLVVILLNSGLFQWSEPGQGGKFAFYFHTGALVRWCNLLYISHKAAKQKRKQVYINPKPNPAE